MLSAMHRLDFKHATPIYSAATLRAMEAKLGADLPPHTLMERAGLGVARLALAIAPHSRCIWVACGPGNNGGDGLEAAILLHQWGKAVVVTWLGNEHNMPNDARISLLRARQSQVVFSQEPPEGPDLCIDALLGIGSSRAPKGQMADWLAAMARSNAVILCVDLPSGLDADTGDFSSIFIANSLIRKSQNRIFTLSLLGMKPGMITNQGRDACGEIWCDDLGASDKLNDFTPTAVLAGEKLPRQSLHNSHKGSYGDVLVIGGDVGMAGAAVLAGDAALHAGAGRVYVSVLDPEASLLGSDRPTLMFRNWADLDLSKMSVVIGCGGGEAVKTVLLQAVAHAAHLVLDADALNHITNNPALQNALIVRGQFGRPAVLTPHPLEAARMLGSTSKDVQADRLKAARLLSERFCCTLVLKGSGTVIASPGQLPVINPTGNGRLATAGTGDVLAGLIGARLAQGMCSHDAAIAAVWQHGYAADSWPTNISLTADGLARSLLR